MFKCICLNRQNLFLIIEHINCLIVSSTNSDFTTFEAIIGDLGTKSLTTLPSLSLGSLVMHSGSMLLCGGTDNEQKCFQLSHGFWKEHSDLNERRIDRLPDCPCPFFLSSVYYIRMSPGRTANQKIGDFLVQR